VVIRSAFRTTIAVLVPGLLGASLLAQAPEPAVAAAGRTTAHAGAQMSPERHVPRATDRLAMPGPVLGAGWRSSHDRAVAVAGDATGLHVLAATAADGYAWHTVATLGARGADTAQWIGQACLTGGGKRAVVVYAPREITNTPSALGYGALAAVVDLATGRVTQLRAGVSISYFDPGCGTGQNAVLTQGGTGASPLPGPLTTRLMVLDTVTGKVTATVTVPGQVTSAVPYRGAIAAVTGAGVVDVSAAGAERLLARTTGTAFRLAPDAAGGLGFQVVAGPRAQLWRYAAGGAALVGTAALGAVELAQVGGRVFVTGPHAGELGRLPAGWRAVDAPAFSQVSSTGALAVIATAGAEGAAHGQSLAAQAAAPPTVAQPVQIIGWATATGKSVSFTVPAAARLTEARLTEGARRGGTGRELGAVASSQAASGAAGAPNPATTTWDPDRACSVPRNDPSTETYQPSDQQIEWAADQAVRGDLKDTRGPHLYGSGLPAYTPQGMFPLPALEGGGTVPPQVLLGILTQESSLDQASFHVIIGQAGNAETSFDWYGDGGNYTYVDWAKADCGYGIAQVTSGMCRAGHYHCANPLPYEQQEAIDVDYQANIAAGLQILADKWNQLYKLGITPNTGNPAYIEDWYFAVWAYNSGLEPATKADGNPTGCSPSPTCTDSGGNWGLGWADNPANDAYPPDRPSFLEQSSAKAPGGGTYTLTWELAHPQYWPYQEKVMGWAFNGFTNYSYVAHKYVQAYQFGKWPNGAAAPAIAPHTAMCTPADHCDPGDVPPHAVKDPANPCTLSGNLADHCWWHSPVTWTSCASTCGTGVFAYSATAPDPGYPGVPKGYAPDCRQRPAPAVVVGDTASSLPKPLGCGSSWHYNGGVMTWQFGSATSKGTTTYPSKIDFHQIAAGYGGHFWFTHTIPSAQAGGQVPVTAQGPSDGVTGAFRAPGGQGGSLPLVNRVTGDFRPSGGSGPWGPGARPREGGVLPRASNCATAAAPSLQVTGTWTPPGLTGSVTVWAALPNYGAQAPAATYQVVTGTGAEPQDVVIDQAAGRDVWVSLGTYNLSAGAHVSLSNVDCSGHSGQDIAWDAMAFVPGS
jgi:hypothetical protein